MNKLIGFFALTSMAAAVVVGCSVEAPDVDLSGIDSGTGTEEDEDGSTGTRTDSGRTEGGTPTDAGTDRREAGNPVACAAAEPATIAYNNPIAVANVCTANEITNLTNLLLNGQGTEPSEGCLQCAITERTAAAWGPIFNGQNDVGFPLNLGGCAAIAGAAAGCGKALQNAEDCRFVVCEPCSANEADYDACLDDPSTETKCDKFSAAVDTGCSEADIQKVGPACFGNGQAAQFVPLVLKAFCGGGPSDGGAP